MKTMLYIQGCKTDRVGLKKIFIDIAEGSFLSLYLEHRFLEFIKTSRFSNIQHQEWFEYKLA